MHNLRFRQLAVLLAFLFFAAACGGETTGDSGDGADGGTTTLPSATAEDDTTEADRGDGGDAPTTTASDAADDGTGDDMPEPGAEPEPNIYDDPRGGIFAEFQQGFDRGDHPFLQYDAFCVAHDPAADRVDTDDGISADSIKVGHIRSRLEDAARIGFAVPVGDPKEMFEVFIDYINEECGGIRGRMLDLGYAEAKLLDDVEVSSNAACLAMTEDHKSVIVMNSTGFQGTANVCLVVEQETIFISTQGQTEAFMAGGNDRLLSLSPTLEESLRFMVTESLDSGAFDGLTLGVAAPDTPGQAEAVEEALVIPLRDAGFEVVFDVINCGGTTICFGGGPESVTNMVNAGVNGFFNVLNIISAPVYIAEMANQGYEPGDVQFFASDFNSQTSELVAGRITENVGAGNLYNGAKIIDFRTTGEYRDPAFEPNPMADMCNRLYSENSPSGAGHDWRDLGDSAYGMVGSVCGIVRIMARGLYDAGDNPTVADVQEAIANLGPVDNNAMSPASIRPGKTAMADVIQTLDFSFPCYQPLPFERADDPDEEPDKAICITGRNDFRPAPR